MVLSAKKTSPVHSFHDILIPLGGEIKKIEDVLHELLSSQVPFVRSVAEYIIENGGKRIRPILTVVSAKMSGYTDLPAYNMGACVEFIHTASLLHDDVIDNAKIRRGRASANAKWGNHVSVLVGDFFYCRASQILTDNGDLKILKIITDCITALTEGEVLEIVTNSDLKTTRDDYLQIIKNKTALLFSASCQVGGVLGGVDPDYELVDDDYAVDPDDGGVPNLMLMSPVDGNSQTSQEIILMGGDDENGAVLEGKRVYEAVYLYTDRLKTDLIDAVEYRDPIYLDEDFCTGEPELGGDDDAFVPGFVPLDYTLGRDAVSTDTNASSTDLILSSTPTPGDVNVPTDTAPPGLAMVTAAGDRFVKVEFSERVDEDDATNISNYALNGGREILRALFSREERTVFLYASVDSTGFPYELDVSGVADVAGNQMMTDSASFIGYYQHSTPLSEIQAYDEYGLSPLEGERVIALGFVSVPPGVFQVGKTSFYIQDLDGYGINIFTSDLLPDPPSTGDLIEIVGEVEEYISGGNGATTEIIGSDDVPLTLMVHARELHAIEPAVMRTGDIADEALEGTLITTSGVIMSLEGFAIYIDDGSGSIQAYQNFTDLDFSKYAFGDSIGVTGVLLQYDYSSPFFGGYELAPRYESDMEIMEAHFVAEAAVTATARVLDIDEDEVIEISYNGPQASHIAVRVFDLQGRSVATLYDGWCLGPQRATWDGKDDRGKDLPPGVYVCQVQARARTGEAAGNAAVPIVIGMKLQ